MTHTHPFLQKKTLALLSLCAAAVCLAFFIPSLSFAGPPGKSDGPSAGDPHGGQTTWDTPPPKVQAQQDPELGRAASGAIFVPVMTHSEVEPHFIIKQGEKLVAQGQPGRNVPVPPGDYTVFIGSGSIESMLEFDAHVVEGRITYVPVEWSGLRIAVVDERGAPFRGTYEIVTLPEREYIGLGLGANIAQGERLNTWLLRPGLYMILSAGESYQARENFVTLRLEPGQLTKYTIVLDQVTGELRGGGEVSLLPETGDGGWDMNLVLGGNGELNNASDVLGKNDGSQIAMAAFLEATTGYTDEIHVAYGRLNMEAGGRVRFDKTCSDEGNCGDRPFVATTNELDLELLYMYRIFKWFGPYTRAAVETQMLPGVQEFTEEVNVRKLDRDGNEVDFDLNVLETRLSAPFSPVELEYGAGVRVEYSTGYWMKFNARAGIGGQHFFAGGLFVEQDTDIIGERLFQEAPDLNLFGIESALILELYLGRWAQFQNTISLFAPFDDFGQPTIDYRGNLALRLTSIFSINYTIRVVQFPQLFDQTQLDQSILLRFAYRLL